MNSRLTDLEKELMVARGKRRGEGKVGEYEMDIYTLLHLRWITNKGLLYSIRNCAECYVAAWMGVGFRGDWARVDVCPSRSAVHLKPLQHC